MVWEVAQEVAFAVEASMVAMGMVAESREG